MRKIKRETWASWIFFISFKLKKEQFQFFPNICQFRVKLQTSSLPNQFKISDFHSDWSFDSNSDPRIILETSTDHHRSIFSWDSLVISSRNDLAAGDYLTTSFDRAFTNYPLVRRLLSSRWIPAVVAPSWRTTVTGTETEYKRHSFSSDSEPAGWISIKRIIQFANAASFNSSAVLLMDFPSNVTIYVLFFEDAADDSKVVTESSRESFFSCGCFVLLKVRRRRRTIGSLTTKETKVLTQRSGRLIRR